MALGARELLDVFASATAAVEVVDDVWEDEVADCKVVDCVEDCVEDDVDDAT